MPNFSRVLEENEELLVVAYPAGQFLFGKSLPWFFLVALDAFLMWRLFYLGKIGLLIFSAVILIVLFRILDLILFSRNNVLLLTDSRLILFKRSGFFKKKAFDSTYQEIHNLAYRFKGVFGKMFHYGDLRLDFKNGETEIVEYLSNPDKLEIKIIALIKENILK